MGNTVGERITGKAVRSTFSHRIGGFPQAFAVALVLSGCYSREVAKSSSDRVCSFPARFAIGSGLCYSLEVVPKLFCFPVAFGPAQLGIGRLVVMLVRRAGRGA